jgi:hypothetical protein
MHANKNNNEKPKKPLNVLGRQWAIQLSCPFSFDHFTIDAA